jgi:hypothetical protein
MAQISREESVMGGSGLPIFLFATPPVLDGDPEYAVRRRDEPVAARPAAGRAGRRHRMEGRPARPRPDRAAGQVVTATMVIPGRLSWLALPHTSVGFGTRHG